jgi:hypothetical protein
VSRCLTGKNCSGGSLPRHDRLWDQEHLSCESRYARVRFRGVLHTPVSSRRSGWQLREVSAGKQTVVVSRLYAGPRHHNATVGFFKQVGLDLRPRVHLLLVSLFHSDIFGVWKYSSDVYSHSNWQGNKASTESHGNTCYLTSPTCLQLATKVCSCGKVTCSLAYLKATRNFFDTLGHPAETPVAKCDQPLRSEEYNTRTAEGAASATTERESFH